METRTKLEVTITYNGIDMNVPYQPNAAIKALLSHALNEFKIEANRHLMSLFTEAGVELDDNTSAEDAGVKPGDLLILRQSTVKGG